MNILIRNVDDAILAALDAEAARRKQSRQEFIFQLLAEWAEPPIVIGWFEATRKGEMSIKGSFEPDTCPDCGQDIDWPWIGILSNGAIHGPVCSICAS